MRHLLLSLLLMSSCVIADDALRESRYCGPPARDDDGRIARRADVIREFQKLHPCPVTGKTTGACVGWAKDHIIPLAVGGCDSVSNLQWLPTELKSCSGNCKDRWERKIYAPDFGVDSVID
jgi:hypothetical protein